MSHDVCVYQHIRPTAPSSFEDASKQHLAIIFGLRRFRRLLRPAAAPLLRARSRRLFQAPSCPAIFRLDVGAFLDQQLHHRQAPVRGGSMKRCSTRISYFRLDIGTLD